MNFFTKENYKVNRFFTKLFYGTFMSDFMFPKKHEHAGFDSDEYILSENNVASIITVLKNFHDIAQR